MYSFQKLHQNCNWSAKRIWMRRVLYIFVCVITLPPQKIITSLKFFGRLGCVYFYSVLIPLKELQCAISCWMGLSYAYHLKCLQCNKLVPKIVNLFIKFIVLACPLFLRARISISLAYLACNFGTLLRILT